MKPKSSSELEAFQERAAKAVAIAAAGGGSAALEAGYHSAIRFVFSALAVLVMESRDVGNAAEACRALCDFAQGNAPWKSAHRAVSALGRQAGVDLLRPGDMAAKHARAALRAILDLDGVSPLGSMYFSSIPTAWFGALYEHLLALRPEPVDAPPGVALVRDSGSRKRSGSFFTPPYIVDFIVSESLGKVDSPHTARVLDPSMGAGDFLLRALMYLSGSSGADGRHGGTATTLKNGRHGGRPLHLSIAEIAENCIFGCDIDPIAVDLARFLIWMETGGRADARKIASHLILADALAGEDRFRWQDAFPDVFSLVPAGPGFDAVIGNPPYVAAKNRTIKSYKTAYGIRGQTDYYLLFLKSVLNNDLVKCGGSLAMVLPDPFLVRGNAADVRRTLLRDWSVESIIHISGAFPSAQVANVVLVCTNRHSDGRNFPVVRLDKAHLREQFEASPRLAAPHFARNVEREFALAQPRSEVLYLVDDDKWRNVFERIHGSERSLSSVKPPYVFLKDMDIEVVFRGEEIGKSAIMASDGELPILLGGQSVHRYSIIWEGQMIRREDVLKPIRWYSGPKILLQKSSPRLIAAYDTEGYIVPQSVYGIRLRPGGYHPLYLLALLNSSFLSEYVLRAFTGYKLVHPQIEIEDVRALPIRGVQFRLYADERADMVREGRAVFEDELEAGSADFSKLTEFVDQRLRSGDDDVIHDLLVHLAERAISARSSALARDALAGRIDRAIDAVVDALYCLAPRISHGSRQGI